MTHAPAKLRILGPQSVRDLLPMDRCIDLMRQAFIQVSQGRTVQPIRQMVRTPDNKGMMGWMPGYTADPARLGLKLITIFPGAVAQGIKSHQGAVLLFEAETGSILAVIDAAEITGIRTAAATAAATDALARADAKTLSIFGCGEQAITHLAALSLVRKFERVSVWGRDAAKAHAFSAEQAPRYDFPIDVAATPQAAAGADVLCLVTGAAEPFFEGAWLKPGQHLNVVGSSIPSTAEVDHETVVRSRIFVDYKDSALLLGGELRRAKEAGKIGDDHIAGEMGEALLGTIAGRRSADDITLFKSLGMASEDLLAADWVLQEAERQGVGIVADW
jgi:ornithine cyclodeaminase/alanine dehydrogenase-like protein (mu-crystallin family)